MYLVIFQDDGTEVTRINGIEDDFDPRSNPKFLFDCMREAVLEGLKNEPKH